MVEVHQNDDVLVIHVDVLEQPLEMPARGVEGMLGRTDTVWLRYDGSSLYRGEQYLADQRGRDKRMYDNQYAVDVYEVDTGDGWENHTSITTGDVTEVESDYSGETVWHSDVPVTMIGE